MVKYRPRSGSYIQVRNIQYESLGKYCATWVKTLPGFLHVQKLVNRRVGYKESGKMTLGGDGTFAMNVERVLLRVQG